MERVLVICPTCQKRLRLSDRTNLGQMARCPQCNTRFELRAADGSAPPSPPPASAPVSAPPAPAAPVPETPKTSYKPRNRNKKKGNWWAFIPVLLVISLGVIAWMVWFRPAIVFNPSGTPAPTPLNPASPPPQGGLHPAPAAVHPIAGDPIRLTSLPGGIRLIVHLRPRELRQAGRNPHELWDSSGPLGPWAATAIEQQTFAKPEEIEELLCGWILGPSGTIPQQVFRIRPTAALTRDLLAQRLSKDFSPGMGSVWRTSSDLAILWTNDNEYVVIPKEFAEEVTQAATTPLPTDRAIEELLAHSSKTPLITCAGIPLDLQIHCETLFDGPMQPLLAGIQEFFEQQKKCEAISVAMNWKPEGSTIELRMRGVPGTKMSDVQQNVEEAWRDLPGKLQGLIPALKLEEGLLPIARRFPAMVRELQQSLQTEIVGKDLVCRGNLSERAWPNLLVGGVLTFYGTSQSKPTAEPSAPQVAKTTPNSPPPEKSLDLSVKEKLRIRVDVGFNQVPLEEAMKFVAQEIRCDLEIDGEALKMAGYTRNMPQTLQHYQKPAFEVFREITNRYTDKDAMVLALEKPEGPIWVTTRSAATAKKWEVLKLTGDSPQP